MTEREKQNLARIIKHCDKIREYLETGGDFFSNSMLMDSVTMRLEAIGELVKGLSEDFRATSNKIEEKIGNFPTNWCTLAGIRDVIAHRYDVLDFETIYDTATQEIPQLKAICEYMLEGEERYQSQASDANNKKKPQKKFDMTDDD